MKYRRYLNHTRKRCKDLGVPHHLQLMDSRVHAGFSGWLNKVLYKPTFIKEMLYGWNDNIVWIDADCRILDKFDLPNGDWDIGVVPHQITRNRLHFTPWVVSLLAVRPTTRAKKLLDFWEHLCQWDVLGKPEAVCSDHERFIWVLAAMGDQVRVQNILPQVRGKVYLDPGKKKESTLKELPTELDDWYPEMRMPADKDIARYVRNYGKEIQT